MVASESDLAGAVTAQLARGRAAKAVCAGEVAGAAAAPASSTSEAGSTTPSPVSPTISTESLVSDADTEEELGLLANTYLVSSTSDDDEMEGDADLDDDTAASSARTR